MDQESPQNQEQQNQTLQQEIQAIGGLPLTHDKLFREVFQWLGLAKAFLRLVLSGPILAKLDLDRLTIEPREFLNIVFKETRADMIYRVPILGSDESLCIYVLLEHKSFNDFFTIFQADQYAGQISQREYQKADDEERLNVHFRFSPVLVIIFHHGERAFTGPIEVAELYEDYGILSDYLPRRRALLFDLSTLSEIPDDPEAPELYAVLRIMQVIFSLDLSLRIREVLERLKPYSEIPKYRRLIRFLWYYFVSYTKKRPEQELLMVSDTVKNIIGAREMTTFLEQFRAEGEAIGLAKGKVLAILEVRFNDIPKETKDTVQSMTDPTALESLVEHAKTCNSLDEFAEAIR